MHRYLRHFLDSYLRGRAGETRHEPPLALVQREGYVGIRKGGQIMYTLADYIGEDKVDLALHKLPDAVPLRQRQQPGGRPRRQLTRCADQPYPDTRMLVDAIRAQTPPELQYLVDDGFNRIVLYDNKAISAVSQKDSDGKYKVTLECAGAQSAGRRQRRGDTPMPLADYIEIGVFSGKKDEEKPLYLKKEKFTEEHKTFTIVVDQPPTLAGIDPTTS
jgi:ABC-2 type transport system permease protein